MGTIAGHADGIGTIIKHIDEAWWEEPCLLYADCQEAGFFTGVSL